MEADGRLWKTIVFGRLVLKRDVDWAQNNIHWWCRWRSHWNTCSLQPIEVNLSIKSPEHTDTPGFLLTFPQTLDKWKDLEKIQQPSFTFGIFWDYAGRAPATAHFLPWLFMRIIEDKYSSKGSFLSYNDQYVNVLLSHCVGLIPLKKP